MKVLFGMALRQTTGFGESLLRLIGLDWEVPDFSTLSRRQKTLKVNIPYRGSNGPLHLLVDRTGIKVEGEGEWKFRKRGGAKRRVNIHIGIDEKTWKSGLPSSLSATLWTRPMLPELLGQITPEQNIAPPPSPPTAPLTPASAMMPSPRAVPAASIRPAITQSRGSPKPPVRSPATRSCIRACGHNHLATTALATPITEVTG